MKSNKVIDDSKLEDILLNYTNECISLLKSNIHNVLSHSLLDISLDYIIKRYTKECISKLNENIRNKIKGMQKENIELKEENEFLKEYTANRINHTTCKNNKPSFSVSYREKNKIETNKAEGVGEVPSERPPHAEGKISQTEEIFRTDFRCCNCKHFVIDAISPCSGILCGCEIKGELVDPNDMCEFIEVKK